ncbi:cuticle protein 18.6 [Bactrocera oleae]|uniref:cuticle protein 18.6 n=1 Tax=Bactrocera oleae TaxID=104688 RepID=UPI00387EA1B7
MAKLLIVLCSFIACTVAKPGLIAPLAAPLAAAPLVTAAINAPLDAAYASSRLDIQQRYGAALFAAAPAKLVASAPVAAPLAAAPAKIKASAPLDAPLAAPVATPLAYTNLPLDAAYASSRLDIHQNYGAAVVPAAFAVAPSKLVASTPVAAPAEIVASAPLAAPVATPLAYTNLPLDAAYASSRLDIHQNYGAAVVPPAFAVAPSKLVASAPVAAPAEIVASAPLAAPVATPLAYTNLPLDAAYASSRLDSHQNYGAAVVPAAFAVEPSKLVASAPVAAPLAAAPAKIVASNPLAAPVAAPLAYTNLPLDAAHASSRLNIQQNYGSAVVSATFAATPAKLVAPVAPALW